MSEPCAKLDTLTSTAASVTSSFFMVFYFPELSSELNY
jgi:hypothetical protein